MLSLAALVVVHDDDKCHGSISEWVAGRRIVPFEEVVDSNSLDAQEYRLLEPSVPSYQVSSQSVTPD
jgi:hypothetical protein